MAVAIAMTVTVAMVMAMAMAMDLVMAMAVDITMATPVTHRRDNMLSRYEMAKYMLDNGYSCTSHPCGRCPFNTKTVCEIADRCCGAEDNVKDILENIVKMRDIEVALEDKLDISEEEKYE